MQRRLLIPLFSLLSFFVAACAPQRPLIPPGVVPQLPEVSAEDEQYGHEVLSGLTERYPFDTNDQRINRVRDLVDRLTEGAKAAGNPWHVYVLADDNFKNAAATRGNYIFVWTGILNSVRDDEELAAVLSHELAHLLAGHTAPDPREELGQILSGAAGRVAREVLIRQPGWGGLAGSLSQVLIEQTLQAVIVNPSQQRKELEADEVGLFIMADARFDPRKAIDFWERVKNDPTFGDFPLQFLSSHPANEDRLALLRSYLPQAQQRYEDALRGITRDYSKPPPAAPAPVGGGPAVTPAPTGMERWIVAEEAAPVFQEPEGGARVIARLPQGTPLACERTARRWCRIEDPTLGYVRTKDLAP